MTVSARSCKRIVSTMLTAAVLTLPATLTAQESHRAAVEQARAHDARHHTKAKIVGGTAVGGAIVGAKVGGPVGALVGAGAGAAGGLAINKAHRHHEVREREHHARADDPYAYR